MPFRAKAPFLLVTELKGGTLLCMYQCPFGLKLHFYKKKEIENNYWKEMVSMPFRAKAPFLRCCN